MDKKNITAKLQEIKSNEQKRKFKQSVEIAINFRDIDIESAEYKLNLNIVLPKGRGRDVHVGVFADGDMNVRAKKVSKYVLNKEQIEEYSKSKRKMRTFANSCHMFIAQPGLMPLIGKSWGIVLGPRGKMPQPVPDNVDLGPFIDKLRNTVRIRSKKNPTIHAVIGTEDMDSGDLADNALAVLDNIERQIPKEKLKSIYVKTTMGPTVKLL